MGWGWEETRVGFFCPPSCSVGATSTEDREPGSPPWLVGKLPEPSPSPGNTAWRCSVLGQSMKNRASSWSLEQVWASEDPD